MPILPGNLKRKFRRKRYQSLTRDVPRIKYPRDALRAEGYSSQYGQDKYINESLLAWQHGGVFVDIGANDGVTISNTLYFESHLSWKGLAVEPLPSAFKRLQRNRGCDCVRACVGPADTTVEFLAIEGHAEMLSGVLSTYDPRHLERIDRNRARYNDEQSIISVDSYRLDSLLMQYAIDSIDYLDIDTEGGELDILQSIDLDNIPVRVISIENNYEDLQIRDYLASKGFKLMAIIGDEIYLNQSV